AERALRHRDGRRARESGRLGDWRDRAHHHAGAVPQLPRRAGARALAPHHRRASVPAARSREPARPALARVPRAVLPGVAVALLELDDVTVRYGGLTAVAGVSLSVDPGQVRALIGPHGPGQTTPFHAHTRHALLAPRATRLPHTPTHLPPP